LAIGPIAGASMASESSSPCGQGLARLPEAAARAHDYCEEAEHEIDRDDVANLIQIFRGLGKMFLFHGISETAPGSEEQMPEQQHHDDADALHDMDGQPHPGEPAVIGEDHAVAADEQHEDAQPYPGEKAAEDAAPQRKPRLGRKRTRGGAQHHVGEEHAAHPQDGGHGGRLAQEPKLGSCSLELYGAALTSSCFFFFFFVVGQSRGLGLLRPALGGFASGLDRLPFGFRVFTSGRPPI